MIKTNYCVVGGGPAGLTVALQLCRAGKSVILVDENDTLGGCHRVIRKHVGNRDLFSEHAPRVYSSAYLNTATLLDSMGSSFEQQFTPYNFSISSIGVGGILQHLSVRELFWLAWAFMTMSNDETKKVSMSAFMSLHDFSVDAQNYVNRLCLLTDGADMTRYSLWQFLELANQQALYSLYQPRWPTDGRDATGNEYPTVVPPVGLFALWKQELLKAGCVFVQRRVQAIRLAFMREYSISVELQSQNQDQKETISANAVILAIPPMSALPLLSGLGLSNLEAWAKATEYVTYIPVSLHYDEPLPDSVSQVYGFPDTQWGIAFIVLSNYFQDTTTKQEKRNGLISTVITMPDVVSTHTGLSANQTSDEAQVVAEVIRQLRERFPRSVTGQSAFPQPTHAFITPGVVYQPGHANRSGRWHNPNTAYVAAANTQAWGPQTEINNVYSVGTHNGNSSYSFTSMESAVTNALHLTNQLEPNHSVTLRSPWTLKPMLVFVIILVLVALFMAYKMTKPQ